jgi:hypothetical protein
LCALLHHDIDGGMDSQRQDEKGRYMRQARLSLISTKSVSN